MQEFVVEPDEQLAARMEAEDTEEEQDEDVEQYECRADAEREEREVGEVGGGIGGPSGGRRVMRMVRREVRLPVEGEKRAVMSSRKRDQPEVVSSRGMVDEEGVRDALTGG